MTNTRNVKEIVFREDLYPRIKKDSALAQRYAENIDMLPPVEINQHNELIDGWHRWTAHRKVNAENINVVVTTTESDTHFLQLAIKRNSTHGLQMDEKSKRSMAIRLYNSGVGLNKEEISALLSVSRRMVNNYLGDIDKRLREERKETIYNMWLACYTQDEIAQVVNITKQQVSNEISTLSNIGTISGIGQSRDFAHDMDFKPPLFNVWTFSKKTNRVSHFGNSEQRIVDNLLYLYTKSRDIVLDPFAGGGSTIDVCRHRGRRYWVADRAPIVERESDIRKHDIVVDGLPPLNRNWSDVTLTYLDPPYWKQAEGKYSNDANDLANMPLDEFTKVLANLVKGIARKQSKGAIALLIQPTQWKAPNRHVIDHVMDLVIASGNKSIRLSNRVSCPYATEQYNAQQVTWAKENKQLLVISRELIVWEVV